MSKRKRTQAMLWVVAQLASITGGLGTIWLAAGQWYITAFAAHSACVFVASAALVHGYALGQEGGGES